MPEIELSQLQRLSIFILPVLFAITVHEVAHGWVAKRLGDPTAQRLGRLTLNPIPHIDPIGTILVPAMLFFAGGLLFGWAKPVPVTWENLRHPKRDMALVAAAGPGANLVMAILWALIARVSLALPESMHWATVPIAYMGVAGIYINLALMVLNLIPVPPLDGGRVATGLLPGPWAYKLSRLEPYGLFILIALLVTGVLGQIMTSAPVLALQRAVVSLIGAS